MAGGDIDLTLRNSDLQALTAALGASSKQYIKAADWAAKRTMNWLRVRVQKELAASLSVAQKRLKTRLSVRRVNGEPHAWKLFVGLNAMNVDTMGAFSQNKQGLKHKAGFTKAGFATDLHGKKGFIRAGRARQLGIKLPNLGSGSNHNQRLPILRIATDIEGEAMMVINQYQAMARTQFMREFESALSRITRNSL